MTSATESREALIHMRVPAALKAAWVRESRADAWLRGSGSTYSTLSNRGETRYRDRPAGEEEFDAVLSGLLPMLDEIEQNEK